MEEKKNLRVNHVPLIGIPAYIALHDINKRQEPVGFAYYVIQADSSIMLVHIEVEPQFRRKGYGKDIIRWLQARYPMMITGYSTHEGRGLCLNCGFEIEGDPNKMIPKLVWRYDHAKGDGAEAKRAGEEEGDDGGEG